MNPATPYTGCGGQQGGNRGATGGQQGEWAGGVSGSGWDVNDAIYASVVGSSSIVYSRTVYSRTVYVEL